MPAEDGIDLQLLALLLPGTRTTTMAVPASSVMTLVQTTASPVGRLLSSGSCGQLLV
ncbi:MAG: hypothetical protein U0793_16525 [Gemmataceae bacterium]